jgi:hypothetical protein
MGSHQNSNPHQKSSIIISLECATITLPIGDQVIATDNEVILFGHHICG